MSHRIKIVDKQMKKLEYLTHVKKLVQLSGQKNHFQKSLRKQRQQIDSLIRQSHKIHLNSLKGLSKVKDLSLANTQRCNYQSVKSVVKGELDRRILTIPAKHKPDNFERQLSNLKLVNKILNAKSQFDFKKQAIQNLSNRVKTKRLDTTQDYSRLYENLFNNHLKQKKIRLFLSKNQYNLRLHVRILDQQNIFQNRTSNPYVIILQNAKEHKESNYYSSDQLAASQFVFEVPPTKCRVSFFQLINQKRIPRFRFTVDDEDFTTDREKVMTKEIEDTKQRVIGLASIELRKKRGKKQHKQGQSKNLTLILTQQVKEHEQQKQNQRK